MTHAEKFLAEVEKFLRRSGMTDTAFGKTALGDPNFVPDLRNGREPTLRLVDKVHAFMKANAPQARKLS